MFTTVEDLFLWDQNFYKNKLGFGSDLISEQLSTGKLNNGEKINYAFGLFVDEYKGLKRVGHTGADGNGFESSMYRYPEQNFSVMCLCNVSSSSPWALVDQVAEIFLADQFKKVPDAVKETVTAVPNIISIPEKELTACGLYFDHSTERHLLYLDDGSLMLALVPAMRLFR
jgi:hypothetical protein